MVICLVFAPVYTSFCKQVLPCRRCLLCQILSFQCHDPVQFAGVLFHYCTGDLAHSLVTMVLDLQPFSQTFSQMG